VTFGGSGDRPEPAPAVPPLPVPEPAAEAEPAPAAEPVAPAPPPEVSEPPVTDVGPADGPVPIAPPTEEPAQSSPSGTYVTFGRAPQPPGEATPAEPPAPIEPEPASPPAAAEPTAAEPVPGDDAAWESTPTPSRHAIPEADVQPPEDPRLTTIAPIAVTPPAEAAASPAVEPAAPASEDVAAPPAETPAPAEVSAPSAAPPAPPPRRRPAPASTVSARAAAAAAIAALVAIVAGYLIAPSSQGSAAAPPTLSRTEVAGPIMLSVPAAWGRQRLATPQVNLTSEIAVGPRRSGGVLAVGIVDTTDPSLLPAGLLAAVKGRPRTVVTLSPGGNQFYRFGDVAIAPGSLPSVVYTLPTSAGAVIGVCAPRAPGDAFQAECERVLGTLALEPGTILALGPSKSLAMVLNTITSGLQTEVKTDAQHLAHAGTPAAQASAAGALARDYHGAGAAVARNVNTVPESAGAIRALSQALTATGDGFAALQRAAASSNALAYRSARTSINASMTELRTAEDVLATWGYVVAG
jgi:hypothetical protein